MPISFQKARYFFWRYLDQTDPVRAIEKWNKGFPDDPATAEEIEAFLAEMVNRMEAGQRDSEALDAIVAGDTEFTIHKPRSSPPPDPGAPVAPVGPLVAFQEPQTFIAPTLTVHEGQPPTAPLPVSQKPKRKLFAKKPKE